ncbi:MAG: 4-hydroxy-tetrahydrodipicolinate synthase [Desulfurococcales archaeon]|nr:4-hydroxy-tetrahydrodipicolinate synthase [Desulfurococcales archaeon]
MSKSLFYGVITPFITPFKEDLSIDIEAVKWLARYQVAKGVHGIFPNSTTGEFVHLKKEESIEITKTVLEEVGGKVWIIPGISSNCTEHSIELGRIFRDLGVDGVIITPPFFFKVSGERLRLHFSEVAEKVDLPIIVYNIPSTTGINIPVDLYVELAKEYSNIAGAKVTYDNLAYFRRLITNVKTIRKDFSVLTGIDYLLLPVLMMGGDGGIMALANVAPQIHRAVYDAWIQGNLIKAYEEYKKLLKLVEIYDIATSFPTSVKTSLKVLGAPVKPYVRPPLTPEPPENEEKIKTVLEELGIKI